MRFGSVCSGIEAASVAWQPLGWQAAWLAEIEPFPSAVLAHHYPDVPNYGDMTKLPARIASFEIEAPDIFCGGTPCQAFSVAGKRESLADERGNLSLIFCDIADSIDAARHIRGLLASIVFWENVPGVLSTKDNAFGCFLAQLCGGDEPLNAPDGWPDAGCVSGPARTAAWRVLDAQYFGLAQRRRRVFVVASARKGFDPAQVLFEWDGVRRDTAPSREARQTAPTIPARSTAGGGLGTDFDCDGGLIQAYGIRTANTSSNGWGIQEEVTHTLDCAQGVAVAHTLRGAEIGFDRGPTLPCNHEAPIAAYTTKLHNTSSNQAGKFYEEYSTSLDANSPPPAVVQPIAFQSVDHGADASKDLSPTLRRHDPMAVAFTTEQTPKFNHECALTLTKQSPTGGGQFQSVMHAMQVRRLTPEECEALQGFPRSYTQIPWRKKPADQCPDGPRYKALGNSWAVPVVTWIGKRIKAAL